MAKQGRRKKTGPSRTGSIIALCVVLALTIFVGYLGFNGMKLGGDGLWKLLPWLPTANTENWPQPLTLGLDLRGGVYIEYQATAPEGREADHDLLMDGTFQKIRSRLDSAGRTEATVQRINENTGFRVEVPDVHDSEAITELIGRVAELSFRDADGQVFMTGEHVQAAASEFDMQEGRGYYISLRLNGEGARLFEEVTTRSIGQSISIWLDDEQLMAPRVNEPIPGGQVMITGDFTQQEAQDMAAQISSGALPMTLTELNHSTVSATLGDNALSSAVTAAFIGILLIMGFMIFRYRLNGVVASWALCIYIIILFFLIALFDGIQLTLPGLAGIVLGIGMAVDANVIIYERFNEEIRAGRDAKNAARAGFKNAKSAILDANVTTLIAGVVLLIAGTGSVKGFATTLLLGVLVSMFTALVVTRFLMTRLITAGADDPRLFCSARKAEEGAEAAPAQDDKRGGNAKKRARTCLTVSAAIIAVTLVMQLAGSLFGAPVGINLGIDFAGGQSLQYSLHAQADQKAFEDMLSQAGITGGQVTIQGQNKDEVILRIPKNDDLEAVRSDLLSRVKAIELNGETPYAEAEEIASSAVSGTFSRTLVSNAVSSVLIAAALMLIYIALRFDLNSGLAAVFGLLHDVLMMLAFMVILRPVIQMNATFIAALLTIVGYSINNTIVIFDRVRENARRMPGVPRAQVAARSVRECLGRTINTTLTTLVTIVLLFILGAESIREFSLPIIIGILSGVYSANLINAYVWAWLEERRMARRMGLRPAENDN